MSVELIPVLSLPYYNQNIPTPKDSPYWELPHLWQDYNNKCLALAEFPEPFKPYALGSSFYRVIEISKINLVKVVKDHLESIADGTFTEDQACALFGGYVLKIKGKNKLFPQCCSDLSDVYYWRALAQANNKGLYLGHPSPQIQFKDGLLVLVCQKDEEAFIPPVDKRIIINLQDLVFAYQQVLSELSIFYRNLYDIAPYIDFKFKNGQLADILIYGQSA